MNGAKRIAELEKN